MSAPTSPPARASVVYPTGGAIARLTPLGAGDVSLSGGFWGERQRINRERTIGHGYAQLQRAGNLTNLRLAAGVPGRYQALGEATGTVFPFLDTDVYKWLEAVGWELGRAPDPALARSADEAIELVARAQRADGYLNTFVQVVAGGEPFKDLAWGHELYCFGHLIQAAIAWQRALGDGRLLAIAIRAADAIDREFGAAGRAGIDGHPEVEMALVELFRTSGERRYLDLAARMVELRGRTGLLGVGRFGSAYWQDHLPVRDAPSVAGHAVRQLYLDCAAVDVATETRDTALLDAVRHRWHDMVATHMYLTGGLGSRHNDESFGDPYELPPDRAYAETCAAIASVMLGWRLLLATGDPDCADVVERTMYNGVLPGVSLDGTGFFYVNTLQRRTQRAPAEAGAGERKSWFPCACCPPNLMRLLSSWEQYQATSDDDGIQIHQFATGEIRADLAGDAVRLAVETAYPWSGRVALTVVETPGAPWTLSLRVPAWCRSAVLRGPGDAEERDPGDARRICATRAWQPGDRVVLDLDMPARVTSPDPRIDAVRGSVALERGPLVYCIETADLPAGTELEDVELPDGVGPVAVPRPDIGDDVIGLAVPALRRNGPEAGSDATPRPIEVGAVPYFGWANRSVEAMRIWIPRASCARASEAAAGQAAGEASVPTAAPGADRGGAVD